MFAVLSTNKENLKQTDVKVIFQPFYALNLWNHGIPHKRRFWIEILKTFCS